MKMKMFDKWLEEITPFGDNNVLRYVEVVNDQGHGDGDGDGNYEMKKTVRIYTDNYVYAIVARDRSNNDGYLGCVHSLRKPYVGEQHTRGRDLPDGPFNKDTWDRIRNAIIANELEPLFKSEKFKVPLGGYPDSERLHFSEPEKLMTPICSCEEIGGENDTKRDRGVSSCSKLSVQ
jgi:hypothetical protein